MTTKVPCRNVRSRKGRRFHHGSRERLFQAARGLKDKKKQLKPQKAYDEE